jgi:hypothetical protein
VSGPGEVRIVPVITLEADEVFDVLEACASAERVLLRLGIRREARLLGDAFELLEDRVTLSSAVVRDRTPVTAS